MFTYNLFVTFLTSKDMSRIITTRSLIDIDQNILCNKGTWIYVFVHTNHLYDVSLYVLNNFFFKYHVLRCIMSVFAPYDNILKNTNVRFVQWFCKFST